MTVMQVRLIETIIISVSTGLAASVVTYCLAKVKKLAKKERAVEKGVLALLRDRITQAYKYHESKGYVAIHDRENIMGMFKEYKDLGGNGTVEGLVSLMMSMPTIPDSELKR